MASTILGKVALTPRGEYSAQATYERLDVVRYERGSWLVLSPCTGQTPAEGVYYTLLAGAGAEGLVPSRSVPYAPSVSVAANTMTSIGTLTGACAITLGEGVEGYDNEWGFIIEQGETAQTLTLPSVAWGLGIAPSFAANSVTQCRLYYISDTLCGEWVCA